jgi:PTS system ascorbate-specific IIA component
VVAFDVDSDAPLDETVAQAQNSIAQLTDPDTLLLTDVVGATPCNVARRLTTGTHRRLLAGVNLPMLWRAMTYRHGPLDELVERAIAGATQGVMQVASVPPQNQVRKIHGENDGDHQQ